MIYGEKYSFLSLFTKALRTDGPTDGRTDPLIEMRGRIVGQLALFRCVLAVSVRWSVGPSVTLL